MEILPFKLEEHTNGCLAVFNSNCPEFFLEEEREEFLEWLESIDEPYWIVQKDERIIGCGGIYRAEEHTKSSAEFDNEVGFAWGMVHRDFHKKGFGKQLATFRINYLKEHFSNRPIVLRTTKESHGFFLKMGFSIREYIKDGWAKGMDKVIMVYGERVMSDE